MNPFWLFPGMGPFSGSGAAPVIPPVIPPSGVSLASAVFAFTTQIVSIGSAIALTAASFNVVAQPITIGGPIALTAASFGFTAQPVTIGGNVALTAASFSFDAHPIDITQLPPLALAGAPVVQYFLDEAASGDPATIEDVSGNNYDMTAAGTDVAANFEYVEVSGNRGVECISTVGNQRLVRAIDNTTDALRDAMAGVQKATIEVVLDMDAANGSGTRIFGINDRAGSSGTLMLAATSATAYSVHFNSETNTSFDPENLGRMVLHIVIDTTQAIASNRIKWSVNGGTLTGLNNTLIQNETLILPSDSDLVAFNRENVGDFDRSWDGILYYAAMYPDALTQEQVNNNYDLLFANDDYLPNNGVNLNAASFGFVAQPIEVGSGETLTTASFNFVAHPIQTSGALGIEVQNLIVLEDQAQWRLANNGADQWQDAYNGAVGDAGPNQVALGVDNGAFETSMPVGNMFYTDYDSANYTDASHWLKNHRISGNWDFDTNRLIVAIKTTWGNSFQGSGASFNAGTYVKPTDNFSSGAEGSAPQNGAHYYHESSTATTAGKWVLFYLNNCPSHERGASSNDDYTPVPEYFDQMTRLYLVKYVGATGENPIGSIGPIYMGKVLNEPDDEIRFPSIYHDGSAYHVAWSGRKWVDRTYEVRYRTDGVSMKSAGFLTGTDAGTTTNPNSAYTGCQKNIAISESTQGIFVAIRVQGAPTFAEIYCPYLLDQTNYMPRGV